MASGNYTLEYIEYSQGEQVSKRSFPLPHVGGIGYSMPGSDTLTWTVGGPWLESTGVRPVHMVIRGTSGVSARGEWTNSEGGAETGPRLAHEAFSSFVDYYLEQSRQAKLTHGALTRSRRGEWRLNMYAEGISYSVVIRDLSVKRRAFGYDYAISATGFKPRAKNDSVSALAQSGQDGVTDLSDRYDGSRKLNLELLNGSSSFAAKYGALALPRDVTDTAFGKSVNPGSSLLEALSGALVSLSEWISEARGVAARIRQPIRDVIDAGEKVQSVAGELRSLVRFPHDFVADLFTAASQANVAIWDVYYALNANDRVQERSRMIKISSAINKARDWSLTAIGAANRAIVQPWRFDTSDTSSTESSPAAQISVVTATLRSGENLMDLSERELGRREYWEAIAAVNGALDASTMGDGSPMQAGTEVLIPSEEGVSMPWLGPAALYGEDVLLTGDYDIAVIGEDTAEEWAVARGGALMLQALEQRGLTPRGENRAWPGFGLGNGVGSSSARVSLGAMKIEAMEQYLRDPRVKSVADVKIESQGAAIVQRATIKTIDGASVTTEPRR